MHETVTAIEDRPDLAESVSGASSQFCCELAASLISTVLQCDLDRFDDGPRSPPGRFRGS